MKVVFFPNVSAALKAGEITKEVIDGWLDLVYGSGESEERTSRISRLYNGEELVQFQVIGLAKAAREASVMNPQPAPATAPIPEEFVRDIPEPVYENPLPDMAGEIKRRLGIIAAVRMFGKPQEHIRDSRAEGVKIRCPFPDHTDYNPSAWVNTDKGVWTCGKCQVGGDVIDFYAAAKHGLRPQDFHAGSSFSEMVKELGAELGLSTVKTGEGWAIHKEGDPWPSPLPDGPEELTAPAPRDQPQEVAAQEDTLRVLPKTVPPSPEASEPVSITTGQMFEGVAFESGEFAHEDDQAEEEALPPPEFDWRSLPIGNFSFLESWMRFSEEYLPWCPPEYFLFTGLQAVGVACGNALTSWSGEILGGNSMIALVGPSGYGKSTVVKQLKAMFGRVPNVVFDRDLGTGVKLLSSPGSAEALVKSIYTEIIDPASPTFDKMEVGVTAWLREDELATVVEKSRRKGGGAMKTRLIELSDFVKSKPEKELVIEDFSITGGTRTLHDCAFSAVFTTQTDAIRSMMDRVDLISGFLNRITPVMGRQRERRSIANLKPIPLAPQHDKRYEDLWRWCRDRTRQLPFTQKSLELIDTHPFMKAAEQLGNQNSLYTRVRHMTLRFAFLLAANNNETEISETYVNAACRLGAEYLLPCFAALGGAVIMNETDECAMKIFRFVKRVYNDTGRWPTQERWHHDRSYGEFPKEVKARAVDLLVKEGRLCRIKVKNGTTSSKVMMIPEDEWASFSDLDGKTVTYESMYPATAPSEIA